MPSPSHWRYATTFWQEYFADANESPREPSSLPQFDRWLALKLKSHKNFGKRDRNWYSDTLFAAFRFAPLISFFYFVQERLSSQYLWRQRKQISETQFQNLIKDFETATFSAENLLKILKSVPADMALSVTSQRLGLIPADALFTALQPHLTKNENPKALLLWHGLPLSCLSALEKRQQASLWTWEQSLTFLKNHETRPPLWLRINHAVHKDAIFKELQEAKLNPRWHESEALQVEGKKSIYDLTCFKSGWIEIQDLASQRLGQSLASRPGDFIWDCCAGGGGKTLQIAAALQNRGAIFASDIREYKLEELKLRIRRAGFSNVRLAPWHGKALPEFGPEIKKHRGFDRILVDAPCSSSGTWRRNPDMKLKVHPQKLQKFVDLQLQILTHAAPALRPGGTLIYGTCSWFAEENEDVVRKFLAQHPTFRLEAQQIWGNPLENADTMFSAIMIKSN